VSQVGLSRRCCDGARREEKGQKREERSGEQEREGEGGIGFSDEGLKDWPILWTLKLTDAREPRSELRGRSRGWEGEDRTRRVSAAEAPWIRAESLAETTSEGMIRSPHRGASRETVSRGNLSLSLFLSLSFCSAPAIRREKSGKARRFIFDSCDANSNWPCANSSYRRAKRPRSYFPARRTQERGRDRGGNRAGGGGGGRAGRRRKALSRVQRSLSPCFSLFIVYNNYKIIARRNERLGRASSPRRAHTAAGFIYRHFSWR